ncbi:MAG: undecaprenyldiphospho-muramoylpentapeptide beta-N-acetylglucosaminyltransferase [Rickettsiaceae bacterium]|nr:undecaprenyldiphospho-muramoylpentapeptide beta-N-acetylglucosaminyltransferase [Rickettsiaceae bacterium]
MAKSKTVLLTAGGTGGHLFPAIALSQELSKSNVNVHLSTDLRCKKYLTEDVPAVTHLIDLHIKTSGIKNKITSLFKLFFACLKALRLIYTIKPNLVIGFGGYPSFPVMAAATLLRVPTIVHEQNNFLGKSNRIFAKFAKIIALSYKETANIDIKLKNKTLFTGDIIRSEIRELPEKNNFDDKTFHLLIFGGSQGAKVFSSLVPEAIRCLKNINPHVDIAITQQAALAEQEYLSKSYDDLNIKYELAEFFYDMPNLYAKSQLVIARSGASTIAELTNIGLPAIFIPYPYAAEDHQYFNAKALTDTSASWSYRQPDISAPVLANKLNELITDRSFLKIASKNLLSRKNNGAVLMATTVLKII